MFRVNILDANTVSVIFKDRATSVILPGEEGELSILDFHQPIIACLQEGIIKIDNKSIIIKRGIAKMQGDELVVVVEK